MHFSIRKFLGLVPILNNRKMLNGHAAVASDCDLKGTDLRMFAKAVSRGVVQNNGLNQKSGFPINDKQIFVFQNETAATWGPIQQTEEVSNKIYIDSGFIGYPIYTTKELGIPGSPEADYFGPPINYRKLGVPAPEAACIVTADAVAGGIITSVTAADVTLEDGETIAKDAVLVFCSADHGLKEGERANLAGFDWQTLNDEFILSMVSSSTPDAARKFILRDITYTELKNSSPATEATASSTPPVQGENWWATPGEGTWVQSFTDASQEDRIYLYTYVTDQGEEGPPAPPSIMITLNPNQACTLLFPAAPNVGGFYINKIRIYRTIPTSTGAADYYYVDEILVTTGTYYDTKSVIELGELMPSLEWDPPVEGLLGFITMPNGIMVGFKDNTVHCSEPYQPHAWPESYRKALDDKIVGIAGFGQSIVVTTDDKAYVGTLTDPLSLTFKKLGSVEPCVSRAACISLGYGVMYPSPNGLMLIDSRGAKNVLADMWDDTSWRGLLATANYIFAIIHNERYYLTFVNSTSSSTTYIFNPQSAPIMITKLEEGNYTGGCVDRDLDKAFMFGNLSSPSGSRVIELDPDDKSGGILNANWTSQTFVMPFPCNFGAAQVFFEYSDTAAITVTFTATGLKAQTFTYVKTVKDQEPFRLPSGFLARDWKVNVVSNTQIESIFVAETIDELRGAYASGG
jgi:hypothetical protein